MTRRRWIADEVRGNTAALIGDHAQHLIRVLRAQTGQQFDISTGNVVRSGTITSVSDNRVDFLLGAEISAKPAPHLTLILSIFKFDRMEWAIEKCTEIGVFCIIPLIAHRTDKHLAAAALKRRERWQRIALQASEQSRRASPPEIAAPIKMAQLENRGGASPAVGRAPSPTPKSIQSAHAGHSQSASHAVLRIVLSESFSGGLLRDAVEQQLAVAQELAGLHDSQVILAIGPEGGWTDNELDWFRHSGWSFASLGDTILRAETAAIVACALALDSMGR